MQHSVTITINGRAYTQNIRRPVVRNTLMGATSRSAGNTSSSPGFSSYISSVTPA